VKAVNWLLPFDRLSEVCRQFNVRRVQFDPRFPHDEPWRNDCLGTISFDGDGGYVAVNVDLPREMMSIALSMYHRVCVPHGEEWTWIVLYLAGRSHKATGYPTSTTWLTDLITEQEAKELMRQARAAAETFASRQIEGCTRVLATSGIVRKRAPRLGGAS